MIMMNQEMRLWTCEGSRSRSPLFSVDFPGGSVVKNLLANAGDTGDASSVWKALRGCVQTEGSQAPQMRQGEQNWLCAYSPPASSPSLAPPAQARPLGSMPACWTGLPFLTRAGPFYPRQGWRGPAQSHGPGLLRLHPLGQGAAGEPDQESGPCGLNTRERSRTREPTHSCNAGHREGHRAAVLLGLSEMLLSRRLS